MESKVHKFYEKWEDGITASRSYLNNQKNEMKIIVEQNRNLGDTLHLVPIIRHYRNLYPEAGIVFITSQAYSDAHEFNQDIDKLFLVPSLNPHNRVLMRKKLLTFDDCKIIAPSIFPYGQVWKELAWSYPNIADQYLHNAGITDLKPNGGRELYVNITDGDKLWADQFVEKHKLDKKKTCALEYHSYSDGPKWRGIQFKTFAERLKKYDVKCVSFCSAKEKIIPGTVDGSGIPWRKTVALLERCGSFVGVGSGLTMLAAACEVSNRPKILEISISDSVTMKGCGYADSIKIVKPDPTTVADHLWLKVLN